MANCERQGIYRPYPCANCDCSAKGTQPDGQPFTSEHIGMKALAACSSIYMGVHVSQLKELPPQVREAWEVGQSLREILTHPKYS